MEQCENTDESTALTVTEDEMNDEVKRANDQTDKRFLVSLTKYKSLTSYFNHAEIFLI